MKLGQGAELQKRLVNIFSFLFFKVGKISVHVQLCSVYYHTHQELPQIEPSPAGGLLQNTGRGASLHAGKKGRKDGHVHVQMNSTGREA